MIINKQKLIPDLNGTQIMGADHRGTAVPEPGTGG